MIELPPNQPSAKPNAVTETSAANLAKQQVSETIRAVVVKVQAEQSAGTSQKPVYDILLQAKLADPAKNQPLTPKTGLAATPITQITPNILQALQQGQTLLIKTQAKFPLPLAAQILATVSTASGIVLKTIIPPTQAQTQVTTHAELSALKQLVPQQQGLTPLLSNLLALTENRQQALVKLPPQAQTQIKQLAQLIPQLSELKQSDILQKTVQNSGIFLEAKIKALVQELQNPSIATKIEPLSQNQVRTTNNLGETLKLLAQRILQSNENAGKPKTITQQNAIPSSSIAKTLSEVLNQDIKQTLNNLRQSLEGAQQKANPSTTQVNPAAPSKMDDLTLLKKAVTDSTPPRAAETRTDTTTKPIHNAIRHYSASAMQSMTPESGKTFTEQILLPPLPGQITVQPQARATPTMKNNEMADALVAILLKQVKGALARVTLHQVASQSQRQDGSPAPQVLSFEIPFIHNHQASVFQFRIEEELAESHGKEKQLEKRWVVQMGFDIEGLGPMLCQISLVKSSASVSFWAEWENTLAHTKAHFDYLENTLKDMGLRVDKLQGHLGIPKADKTALSNQLVDIKT